MRLEEGRRFLAGEGIPFAELQFENEYRYWQDVSFWDNGNRGKEESVTVLRIYAPNGKRHLDLQFLGSDFLDLWFGGFSYELWDTREEALKEALRECIRAVTEAGYCCRIAADRKTGHWRGDACWDPGEDGSLHRHLVKLRRPRTILERIFGTRRVYELYNWNEYHQIER